MINFIILLYNNKMQFQDWEPVKIGGGKIHTDKNYVAPPPQNKKKQNLPGTKIINQLENDEIVKVPKVSYTDSKLIEQKRNTLGISQKELAQSFNVPVNIISDIEKGTSNNNKGLISRINKFLDNKIKKHNPKSL